MEVLGPVYFSSKHHVMFVSQHPGNHCSVFLVWFKKPFLMWGEWCPIFLIRASVEGACEDIAVEAHTGFKERGWVLYMIADERGKLLAPFAIRNSEKVSGCMQKILETMLEVTLQPRAQVNVWLGLPVFFVRIQPL
jgi:hypothetical protein